MTRRSATTLLGTAMATILGTVVATVLIAAPQSTPPQTPAATGGAGRPRTRGAAAAVRPAGAASRERSRRTWRQVALLRGPDLHSGSEPASSSANFKGGINELHQRFREQEVAIFQKHGAEIVGVWQHMGNPDTLVWMLAYRDRAHREEVWAKFNADPEWTALRTKYPVPVSANTFMMSASDYSPMK